MQMEPRMLRQELLDLDRLMRAAVIEDEVEIQATWSGLLDVLQECQKILGGMPLGDTPEDLAGSDIKGRVQAGRAMAFVVVSPALNLPRTHGQQRLGAVQSLNLRLLIHRQHHSIGRRPQIQTHHVGNLLCKLRILADLEALDAVRLQIRRLPDLLHLPARHTRMLGHQAQAPMRRFLRDSLRRQPQDLPRRRRVQLTRLTGPRLIRQAGYSVFSISAAPTVPGGGRHIELATDGLCTLPLRAQQKDPGPFYKALTRRRATRPSLQLFAITISQLDPVGRSRHDASRSQVASESKTN